MSEQYAFAVGFDVGEDEFAGDGDAGAGFGVEQEIVEFASDGLEARVDILVGEDAGGVRELRRGQQGQHDSGAEQHEGFAGRGVHGGLLECVERGRFGPGMPLSCSRRRTGSNIEKAAAAGRRAAAFGVESLS